MGSHLPRWLRPAQPQRMRMTVKKDGVASPCDINIPILPGERYDIDYTLDTSFNGMTRRRDVRITLAFSKD